MLHRCLVWNRHNENGICARKLKRPKRSYKGIDIAHLLEAKWLRKRRFDLSWGSERFEITAQGGLEWGRVHVVLDPPSVMGRVR